MEYKCFLCGNNDLKKVWEFKSKPIKETDLGISQDKYFRETFLCNKCGIYNNFHNYNFEKLYSGAYNQNTYRNDLLTRFNKVMSLPEDKSDNKNRVKRIVDFYENKNSSIIGKKVLDVGSGLCVFLAEFKKYGIESHCIDPDKLSVEHALQVVKVNSAYCGYIEDYNSRNKFDIITLNKVLEHSPRTLSNLSKLKKFLAPEGFFYIELPDSETALQQGHFTTRSEFALEHYTVFNKQSLAYLINESGLKQICLEGITDPSGKSTIFAFASNNS